jgi:hypothetical protein
MPVTTWKPHWEAGLQSFRAEVEKEIKIRVMGE